MKEGNAAFLKEMATDGFTESSRDLGVLNLHLVSGEDIIGSVSISKDPQTGGESYFIKKPVRPNISVTPDETGQPKFRVGLLPLVPYLGDLAAVEIPTVYVMFPAKVNAQMEKLYLQFTSGLILASPGDVPQVKLT